MNTTSMAAKVIDGSGASGCVNGRQGRRTDRSAFERQMMNLDFAPRQMGNPLAFDFAARVAEIAPDGLDRSYSIIRL